jgi:hypothetical protein
MDAALHAAGRTVSDHPMSAADQSTPPSTQPRRRSPIPQTDPVPPYVAVPTVPPAYVPARDTVPISTQAEASASTDGTLNEAATLNHGRFSLPFDVNINLWPF